MRKFQKIIMHTEKQPQIIASRQIGKTQSQIEWQKVVFENLSKIVLTPIIDNPIRGLTKEPMVFDDK